MKIHSYFIIGKALNKYPERDAEALENFKEAYMLAKIHFGEDDIRTEKYKKRYVYLKDKVEF